jgi:hypothetical protein
LGLGYTNLKLPDAGFRNRFTGQIALGIAAYWTSTISWNGGPDEASKKYIGSIINWRQNVNEQVNFSSYRTQGLSVRCIQQLPGENQEHED